MTSDRVLQLLLFTITAVPELNGNLFIGWLFFLKNSKSKLYSGIDFNYANTQNRRSYNYYANGPVNHYRKDILIGIKIGWTISLSKRNTKEFYYY